MCVGGADDKKNKVSGSRPHAYIYTQLTRHCATLSSPLLVSSLQDTFYTQLGVRLPDVYDAIFAVGILPKAVTVAWFKDIFLGAFPLRVTIRVLDFVVVYGWQGEEE